jgi:AcrR family transcriptional regulator
MSTKIENENEKKEKRKEILAAARVVFDKYGYKKTAMVDIAEEVGLNQASLYHYFDNKEEIFIEKLLEDHAKFRNERLKLIDTKLSAQQKITCFFQLKIEFFYGNHIYEQIAECNSKKITQKQLLKLKSISMHEHEFVKRLIENAIHSGELPIIDAKQLARTIFRIFQGIRFENHLSFIISKQKPQTEFLVEEIEHTIQYLFDSLKK